MGFVTDLKKWDMPTDLKKWAIPTDEDFIIKSADNAITKAGQFGIDQLQKIGGNAVTNWTGIPIQDIPEGVGQLGTFVYSTISFILEDEEVLSPLSKAVSDVNFIKKSNLGNIVTFEDVVMSVNQDKNITKTYVSGRSDSIKEFSANGDFKISMSIRLNALWARTMPSFKIRQMFQILMKEGQIEVSSRYLNFFNIHKIVIESFDMKQNRGSINTQMIKLNCISDTDYIVKKPEKQQGKKTETAV